jgi:hypothetical protein
MQLLNQLRDDAGKLADEAIPEVASAVEQLSSGDSLCKVVVSLIGRLEQDIPGLVHPVTAPLPPPLTTPPAPTEEEVAATAEAQAGAAPTVVETTDPQLATLQAELEKARAQVTALQSALTPAAGAAPAVSSTEVPV